MQDLQRLAEAIRARATALGWSQQDLISRAASSRDPLSRTTIQTLWSGDGTYAPSRKTRAALERLLGWAPGSVDAVLEGGDPSVVESSEGRSERDASVPPPTRSLPLAVQLRLEDGRILDHRVITIDVDGEPLTVIALAQTSVYDTGEKTDVLRKQLDAFGRITDSMGLLGGEEGGESEDDDVTGS